MASNNCIWISVSKFPDEDYAQAYIASCLEREESHMWAGMVFKRTLVGDSVYEYHYGDVPPGQTLDKMWDSQTRSRDPFLTQPGSGKMLTSRAGTRDFTGGLIDYDHDEDEEGDW